MQDDVRASLEDLAIRWETPRGRELKAQIVKDARFNKGEGITQILEGFMYVSEVPSGRDLRCITLEDTDMSDAALPSVDLSWASLARSNLQRAILRDSNLKKANLSESNLALAHLDGCDLSRADMTHSSLDGTHFKEAKLTGAVFESADVSRASFDSANLAKANFHNAKLEQTNFFNADCNNCNFDTSAFDSLAARPAKSWGLRHDLERGEFEKQVGLRSITSRTTKKFKGLDVLLRAGDLLAGDPGKAPSGDSAVPYFGAAPLGTRKLNAAELAEAMEADKGAEAQAESKQPAPTRAEEPAPLRAQRPPPRRPPPPRRRPPPRTGGPMRRPTGRHARPRTASWQRPPSGAWNQSRALPQLPLAPLDPNAPEPTPDWAKSIGTLMQLKSAISKIVIELGDKSVIVFKRPDPE